MQTIESKLLVKTVENRYLELKGAWKNAQKMHEEYVSFLADDEEEEKWIIELGEKFCVIEEKTDAYLESCYKNEKKSKAEIEAQLLKEQDKERKQEIEERNNAELMMLTIEIGQEIAKFCKLIDHANKLMNVTDRIQGKCELDAFNETESRLTDSMNNYREIQQKHAILLENVGILESENSGILPMWDADYETCNKIEAFKSQCKPQIGKVVDNSPSSSIRLEKLRFQTFDGDIRKYPKFKAEFLKYIPPLCKSDEIAFILRSYLIDEISAEVDSLGDDIDQIWKQLDKKYGDARKLVDAIMSEIKQMPTCSNSDDQRVLEMINTADCDLKRLDLEKEVIQRSNSTIVSIIDERLPEDIQIEWIRIVTGDKRDEISRDKFTSLLKLLLTCRERIEYKLSEIRFVSAKKGKVNHGELSKTRNEQVL